MLVNDLVHLLSTKDCVRRHVKHYSVQSLYTAYEMDTMTITNLTNEEVFLSKMQCLCLLYAYAIHYTHCVNTNHLILITVF